MTLQKNRQKFSALTFFLLTIAGFINAFGVTVFIAPVQLYDSGISGTAMLMSQLTPPFFSLSFTGCIMVSLPLW